MRYFFEGCALDTDRRELRRGPDVVPTTPQVLDLLEYLIRSKDRVVSKDDLVDAIWNGRIVSDAALTTRLNAVRRAIGDSGEQQRLIKTFPRKGFRFVGALSDEDPCLEAAAVSAAKPFEPAHVAGKAAVSVRHSSERAAHGKWFSDRWPGHLTGRSTLAGAMLASLATIGALAGGLTTDWRFWKTDRIDVVRDTQQIQLQAMARPDVASRLSLVVLPFANLNNDPKEDYFADAITANLTADLARAPATFVIGSEVAFAHKNKPIDLKQFGTDLGIRWAVQGAVRRNGDQVRINVWLTDLQTARDIWSDRFDGDRINLAGLRENITARLLCVAYLHLRQYKEAVEQCSRSLNMIGVNFHESDLDLQANRRQMEKAREDPDPAAQDAS